MDNQKIQEAIKELMHFNDIKKIPLTSILFKRKIAEGGQAKVYRGTLDGEEIAIKVITDVDWKLLAHEIVILSNLTHNSIPNFL